MENKTNKTFKTKIILAIETSNGCQPARRCKATLRWHTPPPITTMIDIDALKNYAYDTIGAIHEVHKELGPGLNEKIYQEGLQLELTERGIPFERELTFHPIYHGQKMEATYRLDFLVNKDIVVELKTVESLISEHKAQLFNYMRLVGASVGILVNFYPRFAEIERYFYDREEKEIYGSDGFAVRKFKSS